MTARTATYQVQELEPGDVVDFGSLGTATIERVERVDTGPYRNDDRKIYYAADDRHEADDETVSYGTEFRVVLTDPEPGGRVRAGLKWIRHRWIRA